MIASLPLPNRFRVRLGAVTGRGVTIGIVDSGFTYRGLVPDTAILPEYSLQTTTGTAPAGPALGDRLGHGTACLTTAYRVAPGASFRSIRIFQDDLRSTPDSLCRAIEAAEETGARVVNLSLRVETGEWAPRVYAACARAREEGLILVAAGHSDRTVSLPAWFDNVLSVESGTQFDPFEFYHRPAGPIDVLAASGIDGKIVTADGEFLADWLPSYAAPVISGIVALVLERHPDASLDDVREVLAELATPW